MKQYQMIKASKDINTDVKKGTRGVILEVLDDQTFIVEFVNENNDTLDNGMTTVTKSEIEYLMF
jgi:PII-like signaling protein